jgi:RHS repeat-associated protein
MGATTGPGPDGQLDQLPSQRPPVPAVAKVPHTTVPMKTLPAMAEPAALTPTAATWPAAGDATVDLAAATATLAPPAARTAGSLPIVITPTATRAQAAVAGAERVHLTDQGSARAAGVTGLLFSVSPATPGTASVGVNYSAFRNAVGADWGSRLRLVSMPACALTTPTVRACQVQTPVPSTNDTRSDVVSATVAQPTSGLVLAAVAGPAGPNGAFTASTLKPSGAWSVSGASGDFNWAYPITTPPAASGAVAPDVALSYDSQAVDGETAGANTQTSWVGEGWDYDPGFVERTYRTCSEDTTLPKADQTGDQCWAGQLVTMSLNGSSVSLVEDDATHTWHASDDNGDRVELLDHDAGNAPSGQYWKITATDGTQYFFGRDGGPGSGPTNATWTEPVYGAHPGDPCNSGAGFAQSSCQQVWRWNLDYVEDPHGNVTMYYYTPETNYYGANNGTTGVRYTRGGYLSRIDYGLRDENNTVYGNPAPDQVLFTVAERCFPSGTITCDPSQFTVANAKSWPDAPPDQQCAQGAVCNNHSPSFWSTKRLTTIATQYRNGSGYATVDSYALSQQFNSQGDPALWLNSITRTGYSADGTSITLPAVTFDGQLMDNRVEGYNNEPAMARYRITNITQETGERINVTYSQPQCTATNVPAVPSQNTMRCFPVYWTLPYQTNQTLDYFHKYVTTEVDVQDPDALSPTQISTYTYSNGPAWHYDDNELVKPANRTYGQFRGYGTVQVRTGSVADGQTLTTTTYFLGMNGDTMPNGGTRAATVTDSLGESVPDADQYADSAREVQVFDGDGGARVSSTITDPATVATTATRARTGLPAQLATIVETGRTRVLTDLAAGGDRTASTTFGYDSAGRVIAKTSSGDNVPSVCTTTHYADDTASWIRDLPSELITSQQACPAAGTTPSPILRDVRTYYDGQTALGTITGAGDATRTDTATANANGNLTFATTATAAFDSSGRPTAAADARGKTTKTAYSPPDGGSLTATVATNALNQTSSVTVDPGRGSALSTVDVAGHRTDAAYDSIGRLTAEWLPNHDRATGDQPSMTYGYLLRGNGPEAVTTNTLVDTGTGTDYTTSIALYDSLGQQLQTQANSEGGGRTVTDSVYDSHGWVSRTNNRYYTDGAPATTLITVADDEVADRTITTHDGTGRAVMATEYDGTTPTYHTQTVYSGDSTTTVPPQGGVTTTTVTDALGRTIGTRQYTASPTITGSVVAGGTYTSTTDQFTALGQPSQITDADGNVWRYGYNMLGRKTSATDPDSGNTTYAYDPAGNLTSSTDARGQTIAYTYDDLNRKTNEYQGSPSGPELASWVYDTVQPGKLSYSTRDTAQGQFLIGVSHYDGAGNAMNDNIQVPTGVPGFGGTTFTTSYGYTTTNLLASVTPAAGGGLDANSIAIGYDSLGNQITSRGDISYLSGATYTPFGEPAQYDLGTLNTAAWLTYDRDPQTRRVTGVNFSAQTPTPQLDDTTYTYDQSGNPTGSSDVEGSAGAPTETQCDGYDALDRLTSVWTANTNCAATPSTATIGGPNPFWESWTFDPTGLRTSQVRHAVTTAPGGDTTTAYAYPAKGATQADTLTSATTTGPAGTTTTKYGYDATGNTTAIGDQALTWDTENRLAGDATSHGTTSYVYDTDGNVLLQTDPGSATLYLPNEQLAYSTSTRAVTGTRYISVNGQTIAIQVGSAGPVYVDGDQHSTMAVTYDPMSGAVSRRTFDPYGNQIGQTTTTGGGATGPGTWPDQRSFLGDPVDGNTGLTDIGARQYDATTGRFISVDPELHPTQPQTLNGYTYAGDNPVTNSDPTGRMITVGQDGPQCYTQAECNEVQTMNTNTQTAAATREYNKARSTYFGKTPAGSQRIFAKGPKVPGYGIIIARFFIPTKSAALGFLLGDDRGFSTDPDASYRMTVAWDTDTGEVSFTVTPSTKPVDPNLCARTGACTPQVVPARPICSTCYNQAWVHTLRPAGQSELYVDVSGMNSVLPGYPVYAHLAILPVNGHIGVVDSGTDYPNVEVVQYRTTQPPRYLAQAEIGPHGSAEAIPIGQTPRWALWSDGVLQH